MTSSAGYAPSAPTTTAAGVCRPHRPAADAPPSAGPPRRSSAPRRPVSSATSRRSAWAGVSPARQRPVGISSRPRTTSGLSRRCSRIADPASSRSTMAAMLGTTSVSSFMVATGASTHSRPDQIVTRPALTGHLPVDRPAGAAPSRTGRDASRAPHPESVESGHDRVHRAPHQPPGDAGHARRAHRLGRDQPRSSRRLRHRRGGPGAPDGGRCRHRPLRPAPRRPLLRRARGAGDHPLPATRGRGGHGPRPGRRRRSTSRPSTCCAARPKAWSSPSPSTTPRRPAPAWPPADPWAWGSASSPANSPRATRVRGRTSTARPWHWPPSPTGWATPRSGPVSTTSPTTATCPRCW